jgi:ppGpp synthetase/RelA/SpoT-type nucleotidyltranferase
MNKQEMEDKLYKIYNYYLERALEAAEVAGELNWYEFEFFTDRYKKFYTLHKKIRRTPSYSDLFSKVEDIMKCCFEMEEVAVSYHLYDIVFKTKRYHKIKKFNYQFTLKDQLSSNPIYD